MTSEERLAQFIARSREARQVQASRVSDLISSITTGIPYEFDPTNNGEQPVTNPEGGELSEPEGEAGAVVGSFGESNDSGPSGRTEEKPVS